MFNKLLLKLFRPENAIEQASVALYKDPTGSIDRLMQTLYYGQLWIPQPTLPEDPESKKVMFPIVKATGRLIIPIYTSERLLRSVAPHTPGASILPGSTLSEIWPEECWMALNASTPIELVIRPDAVRSMPNKPVPITTVSVPAGTAIALNREIEIPEPIQDTLLFYFHSHPEIVAAFKASMLVQIEGEEPHLLLGLLLDPEVSSRRVYEDLQDALRKHMSYVIDMIVIEEPFSQLAAFLLTQTEPFYHAVA